MDDFNIMFHLPQQLATTTSGWAAATTEHPHARYCINPNVRVTWIYGWACALCVCLCLCVRLSGGRLLCLRGYNVRPERHKRQRRARVRFVRYVNDADISELLCRSQAHRMCRRFSHNSMSIWVEKCDAVTVNQWRTQHTKHEKNAHTYTQRPFTDTGHVLRSNGNGDFPQIIANETFYIRRCIAAPP